MSHPNIDRDGVWRMSQPIKLYLFKDEESVKISFRVTDYMNIGRSMSEEHFQYICDNWREGVEGLETKSGKYYWYLSKSGPRPEQVPCEFVQINTGPFSFRISVKQMEELVAEFDKQKITKMHWDD